MQGLEEIRNRDNSTVLFEQTNLYIKSNAHVLSFNIWYKYLYSTIIQNNYTIMSFHVSSLH